MQLKPGIRNSHGVGEWCGRSRDVELARVEIELSEPFSGAFDRGGILLW